MKDDGKKHEYFDFLVYPGSAPEDWRKTLKASHAPFVISPLHSPDEEQSKPHYHVIYKHGNPIMYGTALSFLKPIVIDTGIAANGHVEITFHPRGYMRYLIHLDDLDKQQFDGGRSECTIINGFPLDMTRELSKEQLREIRKRIFDYIQRFEIVEYSTLIDELWIDDDMLDYACNHTIMFNSYLTSRRNKLRSDEEYE